MNTYEILNKMYPTLDDYIFLLATLFTFEVSLKAMVTKDMHTFIPKHLRISGQFICQN